MEIYIIANIRDTKGKIKGYRLIDIDDRLDKPQLKDVTKEQLINILRMKKLKLENAKLNRDRINGIYQSIDTFPSIVVDNQGNFIGQLNVGFILLKRIEGPTSVNYVISNQEGIVKTLDEQKAKQIFPTGVVKCTDNAKVVKINNNDNKVKETHNIITDEEARDENIVWSVPRFVEYMRQQGYSYELYRNIYTDRIDHHNIHIITDRDTFSLGNIDPRCKIIHIPDKVTDVLELISTNNIKLMSDLDTLIIPSSINRFAGNALRDDKTIDTIVNIKNVILQFDEMKLDTEISLAGLHRLSIDRLEIKVNKHIKIVNAFNFCRLKTLNIFKNTPITISDSFSDVKVADSVIDTGVIESISGSFRRTSGIKNVRLGKELRRLCNGSFSGDYDTSKIYGISVDFSDAINLNSMNSCFNYVELDNVIDLRACKNLRVIEDCFRTASRIEEVHFNEGLLSIKGKTLENAVLIKRCELPKSVSKVQLGSFNPNTEIVFPELYTKTIDRLISSGTYMDELFIDKQYTSIDREAMQGLNIYQIVGAPEIIDIGAGAFSCSSLERVDYSVFNKVKVIKPDTFSECDSLKEVIITDNVVEIGDNAFRYCESLYKVAISDSVKYIGKDAFRKKNSKHIDTIFYVVKNSVAHKYLSNKRNTSVCVFDSFEDALAESNLKTLTRSQKNKIKMLAAVSEEYSDIKHEPYIRGFSEIIKLKNYGNTIKNIYIDNIDYTPPYCIKVDTLAKVNKFVDNIRVSYAGTRDAIRRNNNKTTVYFNGYLNLISKLSTNVLEHVPFEKVISVMRDTERGLKVRHSQCIYIDDLACIMRCRLKVSNTEVSFIVFVFKGDIIWISAYNRNSFITDVCGETCMLNSIMGRHSMINNSPKVEYNYAKNIKIGDNYKMFTDIVFGGVNMPSTNEYKKMMTQVLRFDFIMLGMEHISKVVNISNVSKKNPVEVAYMYSLTQNKVIKVKIRFETDTDEGTELPGSVGISTIKELSILDIMELSKFIKDVKNTQAKEIVEMFRGNNLKDRVKFIIYGDNLVELTESSDAFDFESELYKQNIILPLSKSITYNKTLTEYEASAILKSGLCMESDIKLMEAFNKIGQPKMIPLLNSNKYIFEWVTDNKDIELKTYLLAIASLNEDVSRVKVYTSYCSIKELVNNIVTLGGELQSDPLHEINNTPINTDDFCFLHTLCGIYGGIKYYIAIQKQTLECFILTDNYDMEYYVLLRVKKYIDAVDMLFNRLKKLNDTTISLRYAHDSIIAEVSSNGQYRVKNEISNIRNHIRMGHPNGYFTESTLQDVFDKCSKQNNVNFNDIQ